MLTLAIAPVHSQVVLQYKTAIIDDHPQPPENPLQTLIMSTTTHDQARYSPHMESPQEKDALGSRGGRESVTVKYDNGKVATGAENRALFVYVDNATDAILTTRFAPKAALGGDRDAQIDSIWLAPYFLSQFEGDNLPPTSAPRDLTVYIYSDQGGQPGDVLFSKMIKDPREFFDVKGDDLAFFGLDLSNESIGALPDIVHIGYGNAGSDANHYVFPPSPYATRDLSLVGRQDRWIPLWDYRLDSGTVFDQTVIPIRARFSSGAEFRFAQRIENQIYTVDKPIKPLVLQEATGGKAPISYSLTPALPAGLNFDSSTRTINGTPTQVAAPTRYIYRATDADEKTADTGFTIEVSPATGGFEFVDIQYDDGEIAGNDAPLLIFFSRGTGYILTTRFVPKTTLEDTRNVRIDRISLSPYFFNQFNNSDLPTSAPRDLTVYIYSDQGGEPKDVLFSKVIEDPRDFFGVNSHTLKFFDLDLSNEGIGILPDVVHIGYGNAGSDENYYIIAPAPYTKRDVSHLYVNDHNVWIPLWNVTARGLRPLDQTVIPIRARFSIGDIALHTTEDVPDRDNRQDVLPVAFTVHGNYPNPFRQSTNLLFDLPLPSRVTVEVVDLIGRRVLTMPPVDLAAGWGKRIKLDGQSLVPGHYLYRVLVSSAEGTTTRNGQLVRFR